ncbi:MAG: DNA polymerase III subunit delta [Nitrospiria bacterium]
MLRELIRALEGGRIDPLYLLTGEETWLIDQALSAFRRHAVAIDDLLNTHLYSGLDVSPAEVVAMAETLPAFAARRLIIVRDAERLTGAESLTAYSARPSPTTCLVLAMAKPDRRKTVTQALLKHATVVSCDPLTGRALKEWIAGAAREQGLRLTDEAMLYLQERSGGSLRALSGDLEKLALSRTEGSGPLGVEQLDIMSPGAAAVGVFDWAHAVALSKTRPALKQLHTLLQDEAPLLLVSILIGQWRKMVKCRDAMDRGIPQAQMAQALEIPPFAVGRVMDAARVHRPADLIAGLTWCLETDAALKGGALAGPLAVERLVMALCEGAAAPPLERSLTGPWWPGLLARRQAVGVAGQTRDQT